MFREIREIKSVEKEKSEKEKELDRLRLRLFDCRIGSEEAIAIQNQIAMLNA